MDKKFSILITDNFNNDNNLKKIKNKYTQMLCYEIFSEINECCFGEIIKNNI